MDYVFYVADTETTGLDPVANDVIELSLYRLNKLDNDEVVQKTWCFKPLNTEAIDPVALKINGHKLEDLLHKTKEGKERYLDPHNSLIEVENWLAADNMPAEKRLLIGQNIAFDKAHLEHLWKKCESPSTFPFGRRIIDLMVVELFFDFCRGEFAEGYNLNAIAKKYGIKNEKSHTAAADTLATKQAFEKQVEFFRKLLK